MLKELIRERAGRGEEAENAVFCPLHEKLHTVVSHGVGNISDTLC
jgi:hypothetical protein